MQIRIEACGNTPVSIQRVFGALEPPVPVARLKVRAFSDGPAEVWWITGWDAEAERPCPAFFCRVADSGEGAALLVYGGSGGVRISRGEPPPARWSLDDPAQEGEPYLLLGTEAVEEAG